MTIQQALAQGLSVTGVGLAIVFAVLVILMLVMMAMKQIFYKDPAKTKAKSEPAVAVKTPEPKAEKKVDDDELIAVLTAAVAASLNTSTYNLRIKSYRRVQNNKPAWNRAGISDTINSRY